MEQDSVRTAPGLDARDHEARLRVHHDNGIVVEISRIEQVTIGGKGDVADEVGGLDVFFGYHGEDPRRCQCAVHERELVDGGFGTSAHVDLVAGFAYREAQPAIGHRDAAEFLCGGYVDHTETRRIIAAVQDQQELFVRRDGCRHRERVDGDLCARGFDAPAAA